MSQGQEFTRYVGYDNADEFRGFLIEQYAAAQKNGLFIKEKLPLATTTEISAAAPYTAADFENAAMVKRGLDAWLSDAHITADSEAMAEAICTALSECGANRKNTYFIIICWIMKYLGKRPQTLTYIGGASLRELYFLYIMSLAGVKVTLVSYGLDTDYVKLPYRSKITVKSGQQNAPLQVDYAHIDLSQEAKLADMRASGERVGGIVKRLQTSAAGLFEDIMLDRKTRVVRNGGVYTEDGEIPVYSAALIGCEDDAVYTNMLVKFKENFAGSKKQLIFIEKPLSNPDFEEVKALGAVTRSSTASMIDSLALLIKLNGDNTRTALAQRALREILHELDSGNQTVIYNYGSKFVTWLYRCTQARRYSVCYEDIPTILYYGDISQSEMYFLAFMARCGFDTLYITPDKNNLKTAIEKNIGGMQVFELSGTKESGSYPDKPVKMKAATVAYNAERELDTMLYGGDAGIFRSFQFPNSRSLTLKTTYEEIGILWRQEAKFRQGFEVSGNLVTVPNIFAKISGVNDGNINGYWDEVRSRLTPDTTLFIKKQGQQTAGTTDLSVYRSFYRNGEYDLERIKASTLNKYSYLPDRLQDMLFYKLQETVNSGFISLSGDELMCSVLHFGMSLDKEFLKTVQRFDFTKQIPKIIYIDTVEDTFTLQECIHAVICNIIGFDILIYTPTGYKNIETFVKPEAFEEHMMNEFLYNLEVPKLKIPADDKSSGLFGKLFRK
ncbi:MAG: YceG family protein [Oscillospiraceae bacterium]